LEKEEFLWHLMQNLTNNPLSALGVHADDLHSTVMGVGGRHSTKNFLERWPDTDH
jgi:hypothetical protein